MASRSTFLSPLVRIWDHGDAKLLLAGELPGQRLGAHREALVVAEEVSLTGAEGGLRPGRRGEQNTRANRATGPFASSIAISSRSMIYAGVTRQ